MIFPRLRRALKALAEFMAPPDPLSAWLINASLASETAIARQLAEQKASQPTSAIARQLAEQNARRCPTCHGTNFIDWAHLSIDPCHCQSAPGGFPASTKGTAMHSDSLQATEQYSAARATHPRVTLDDIKANVGHTFYFTAGAAIGSIQACDGEDAVYPASLDLLTICLLTTTNGFTIIGKSAPASLENFDAEKGKTFAYEDAIRQLWPLMGYALREKLAA